VCAEEEEEVMEVMKVVNVLRQRALIKGGREAAQWMAAGRNWTPLWDRQAPDAVLESAASRIGRSAGRVSAGGAGGNKKETPAGPGPACATNARRSGFDVDHLHGCMRCSAVISRVHARAVC
jgi:hypothetical protein